MSVASSNVVSLSDRRLFVRLRRGEPAAYRDLWAQWRNAVWSVCVAVQPDRAQAVGLLKAVYRELPAVVRGWPTDEPLCCLLGAHVYRVIRDQMELPDPAGIQVPVPSQVRAPSREHVRATLQGLPPMIRLVYTLDLFFGCSATTLARLLDVSEDELRHCRSVAAYGVIAAGGAE